ncbi:WD40-repeat-containing domain protein [Tricharina praecox]|uniref:WD40-repeat-containing domain protein n=1 Tax=Tricharina praecox TaxID=43433 RepID=UPI0022203ED6|nr:WD40-repeat-containing domain protein [Tricharina praecox]KAI5852302.1 WD40-repeat-containing domain protein [Tricharina praecox]
MTSTQLQGPLFAHPPGQTIVNYSPDGRYLYTAGTNTFIRKYTTASEDEPVTIDTTADNTGIVATNDKIISCSEDCSVSVFSSATNTPERLLLRTNLPARGLALSPDGSWLAVASDDRVVKLVNLSDPTRVLTLRGQSNSNKHVSYDPSGKYIAVSCTDGAVYVYTLSGAEPEPELVQTVDGVILRVEAAGEASAKVAWCPDGRAFAAPTATGDVVIVDCREWKRQRSFAGAHTAEITDFAWSPNGAFLVSAAKDGKIVVWEAAGQTVVATYLHRNVCALAWHPSENTISFTTTEGRLYTLPGVVPGEIAGRLKLSTRPAPLIEDSDAASTTTKAVRSGQGRPGRRASPDPLDGILGAGTDDEGELDGDEEVFDWIENDDNDSDRGPNVASKRKLDTTGIVVGGREPKRPAYVWTPTIHEPFQPSATPWRGKRRYLCLNMVGFVWTVDQDTHNTVTVEFHDRESFRDVHFTDQFLYDKACLNETGGLFSCQPQAESGSPAMLYYRPHESWANRGDWRTSLPDGEEITSIALSDNYIVACTNTGYVRVFTLFGIPFRIYRQKHTPVVTCASYRDYVLILGNGAVGADGKTQLTYTLENIARDETLQSNDVVALPPGGELKSVFFSENGDPAIYDSDGVLLVLQHWREVGQARWTPLLDTRTLERLAGGRREEKYWPVAVAQDKFHCIILKGGEQYPYFPRPLLSEFDFKIPLVGKPAETAAEPKGTDVLEETYVRNSILLSLQRDSATARTLSAEERMEIVDRENGIDRALLQLLMIACKEEDQGAKALEICGLFRQKRTLDMAVKVAIKYDRSVLAGKIGDLRNKLEMAMEMEDD